MLQQKNELIAVLNKCAAACNFCSSACLGEADVQMMVVCVRLDMDCAAVCDLAATLLGRVSVHGKHILKECIELCGLCATECEKHKHMKHCIDCAAACRECERACKAAA